MPNNPICFDDIDPKDWIRGESNRIHWIGTIITNNRSLVATADPRKVTCLACLAAINAANKYDADCKAL